MTTRAYGLIGPHQRHARTRFVKRAAAPAPSFANLKPSQVGRAQLKSLEQQVNIPRFAACALRQATLSAAQLVSLSVSSSRSVLLVPAVAAVVPVAVAVVASRPLASAAVLPTS